MDDYKNSEFSFDDNPDMAKADAFVRHTGSNLFLTGKAGTGKTTFLQGLKSDFHKQIMVTAPTGVAAINAGGVTLHSFFQLPFGPYIPGQTSQGRDVKRFFRFSKEKKRIIKGLDLLVIDEISMVRADLLDSVDAVLRRLRRDERPFGGVQLLLIGDLFQLPPVAKPDEWQLLRNYYSSIYFFSSHALGGTDLLTIELKKIYRQSDEDFIRLLNSVRENKLDHEAMAVLNQCADKPLPEKGYITLTTHNKKADALNRERLARLEANVHELRAEVSGEFPDHSFPTPDRLVLKKGAQVMFLRNDASADKQYYNGKIGKVSHVSKDRVFVSDSENQGQTIEVAPVEWENVSYKVNEEDQTIQQEVIGRFSQIPLKLAWAVTIHKSQGLTFDRAIVDAQSAFAHGQTYVALSRCRTLEGLVLSSPVPGQGIEVDQSISDFMAAAQDTGDLATRFENAQMAYQQELLNQCFDFQAMRGMFYYFIRLVENNVNTVRVAGLSDPFAMKTGVREQIFEVGEKFLSQLRGLMADESLPDSHPRIRERTRKAAGWFSEKFAAVFGNLLEKGQIETDNKALKKQMTNGLTTLCLEIRIKMAGIQSCTDGFSSVAYLRAVSGAGMIAMPKAGGRKAKTPDYTEFDIAHPELFKAVKDWRTGIAKAEGIPHFHVLHQKVLVQIAVCLPDSEAALSKLKGVGPKILEKYGEQLIDLVKDYRESQGIETVELPAAKPEEKTAETKAKTKVKMSSGPNTKDISLAFFEKGMGIEAIAEERGLAVTTIQGHLCNFIETGVLSVEKLVAPDKQATIEKAIAPGLYLRELKEILADDITYGEIKAVLAHQKFKTAE